MTQAAIPTGPRSLITGATGFVGTHLCRFLRHNGRAVVAAEHDQPRNRARELPYPVRFMQLRQPDTLAGICREIDSVYHLAGIPREQANTMADYRSVNVEGTRALLDDAVRHGVKRFVYVSSIDAAGPSPAGLQLDEQTAAAPINNYGRSKLEAEQVVLSSNGEHIETTVVRLPLTYGPGNWTLVPKLFGAVNRGLFPIIGSGTSFIEVCFIENAVLGIALAGELPTARGECFYIAEEPRRLIDVVAAVRQAVGGRATFIHIPTSLAYAAAVAWEGLAFIVPRYPFVMKGTGRPLLSRKTVYWATRPAFCSTQKAQDLLGFHPTFSLADGLRITVDDFKARGWI